MNKFSFVNVLNFRSVNELRIYRSANWDNASYSDVDDIIKETGIVYRIDLRSIAEKYYNKYGKTRTVYTSLVNQLSFRDIFTSSKRKKTIVEKNESKDLLKYSVNFTSSNYRKNVIWNRLDKKTKLQFLLWLMSFQYKKITMFIGKNILGPRGLLGMNTDFLDYSQDAIKETLKILVESLEKQNGSVQYSCQYGRDRTGIITMLLRYVLDDSIENIALDYSLSEKELSRMDPSVKNQFMTDGLPEEFGSSPIYIVENVFKYLETNYGSVDKYLDKIGFTTEYRIRLRNLV